MITHWNNVKNDSVDEEGHANSPLKRNQCECNRISGQRQLTSNRQQSKLLKPA